MSANSVLKSLTDTAFDSVEGYRKAAEKADNPQLKQALQQRCQKREQTVAQMNAEIQRQGGELVTKGTMTGEAHQMWMSIADAFENSDEAAAERVEEGEDYLKGKFESALEDDSLDPQSRSVVQQCYAEICEGEQFGDQIAKQFD
ncbi:PA2169 family four-helix-bundle protein [Erythrobacter alti]|uniref:ferritin-like domain-containing protein n=1 Tax=Erythrobacter alti TaxID=1896145 RepID=UPI0030F433E5